MPHLQLTLTRNLLADVPAEKLLSDLVTALSTFDTVDPAAVKAYVTVPELYVSGPGTTGEGAHLTVCLMEGRETSLLEAIADRLFEILRREYPVSRADVTVEIREMTKATYRRGG